MCIEQVIIIVHEEEGGNRGRFVGKGKSVCAAPYERLNEASLSQRSMRLSLALQTRQ